MLYNGVNGNINKQYSNIASETDIEFIKKDFFYFILETLFKNIRLINYKFRKTSF